MGHLKSFALGIMVPLLLGWALGETLNCAGCVKHAHAQAVPFDPAQQLRELAAETARKQEHADAVHEQLRVAREGAAAQECAATFDARREEARQALAAWTLAVRAYARSGAGQKIAWFNQHCRFLSPLEIAIRKLDDPNSFVCDTSKGRPAGLTSRFVLANMDAPEPRSFQEHDSENLRCEPYDARSLVLR